MAISAACSRIRRSRVAVKKPDTAERSRRCSAPSWLLSSSPTKLSTSRLVTPTTAPSSGMHGVKLLLEKTSWQAW